MLAVAKIWKNSKINLEVSMQVYELIFYRLSCSVECWVVATSSNAIEMTGCCSRQTEDNIRCLLESYSNKREVGEESDNTQYTENSLSACWSSDTDGHTSVYCIKHYNERFRVSRRSVRRTVYTRLANDKLERHSPEGSIRKMGDNKLS